MQGFTMTGFLITLGVCVIFWLLFRRSDRWIKKMNPKTVKTLNWAGFITGTGGGVIWYLTGHPALMFPSLIGVVVYFLFYNYDNVEQEQGKQS